MVGIHGYIVNSRVCVRGLDGNRTFSTDFGLKWLWLWKCAQSLKVLNSRKV